MNEQIIKRFKKFQKETGQYSDLDIEAVTFEYEFLGKSKKIIFNPSKADFVEDLLAENALVSFVPMSNIHAEKGEIIEKTTKPISKVIKGSYRYFETGDVIFAKVTPCMENGNCAIARDLENGIGFGSSEFYVFRGNGVDNRYLWHFLRQESLRNEAKTTFTGAGGLKRVPKSFFVHKKIPIPILLNEKYSSFALQIALVDFIEYYKNSNEKNLTIFLEIEKLIEKMEQLIVPLFFRKDKSVVWRFNRFCKASGVDLTLEEMIFEKKSFNDILDVITSPLQLNKKQILNVGLTPVVNQSAELINGYYNSLEGTINASKSPIIIFGDHTTVLKYIDFDFIVGASGTKVLQSRNNQLYRTKYIYFNALNKVKLLGYQRHFSRFRLIHFSFPCGIRDIPSSELQDLIIVFFERYFEQINNLKNTLKELDRLISLHTRVLIHKTFNP